MDAPPDQAALPIPDLLAGQSGFALVHGKPTLSSAVEDSQKNQCKNYDCANPGGEFHKAGKIPLVPGDVH